VAAIGTVPKFGFVSLSRKTAAMRIHTLSAQGGYSPFQHETHAEVLHVLHRDVRHAVKLHHTHRCPGRMLVNDSHHQLLPAAAIADIEAGATAGGRRLVG
jgi:hypothetical protein